MEKEIDTQTEMATVFEQTRVPYESAFKDDAPSLKNFYSCRPDDTPFMPITAGKDTVFHIAAYRGSEELLRVLLEMVPRSRKRDVLKLKNIHGNTILHEVAVSGNVKAADFLVRTLLSPHGSSTVHEKDIREREEILADRNNLGETPLYRAAAFGSAKMVMYLAKEIEEVGTLHDHFKRNDGISILHVAVIYQKFDSAIWLLNKDPNLACYKMEKDGKTCLHLLASMPTAFRSTSPENIFAEFLYDRLPDSDGDNDDDDDKFNPLISSIRTQDLEHGRGQPSKISDTSFRMRMYRRLWRCLAEGWKTIEKLWTKKKMNTSAVKLMGMLVRRDASWLVPHEAEEDNLICLDREEEDMETGPSAKRRSRLPDTPLLMAARTGIREIVEEILKVYPQAVEHVNQNGQNILHLAIMHRQSDIFKLVNQNKEASGRLVLGIDNYGCTILHYTAVMEYYTGGTSTTIALKLQEELKWFKDVQHSIPLYYTMHRNKEENLTAKELFNKKHRNQHEAAQEWVKNTSQSCSTVAVLVATVVFAAAYTAPGGYLANGKPLLLERPLYSFFTVMDVAGLASSLTSVVVFLSVLTSSLEIDDFLQTLPRKLTLGFIFLFFSVTATMLSFTATILLLIHLEKKWTATLTYAAAFLPICVFAVFQFPLYREYTVAAIKGTVEFIQAILPGRWDLARFKPN